MTLNKFERAINIQHVFVARILRTTNGGWICSIDNTDVFLPGSLLYNGIRDYEACVGKFVKVMVLRADKRGVVVSHKDYVSKIFERKEILSNLKRGQNLKGIVKDVSESGYYINVLGIIGFMPNSECEGRSFSIDQLIDVAVSGIDVDKSKLYLSYKLYNSIIKKEKIKSIEKGFVLKCVVEEKVKGGYLVDLGEAIGYIPIDEIPLNFSMNLKEHIEAVVTSVDYEKCKVLLSVKVLEKYKYIKYVEDFVKQLTPNVSRLEAKVLNIQKDFIDVEIQNIKAKILRDDISSSFISKLEDHYFVHQCLDVVFKEYKKNTLYCSLLFAEEEKFPEQLYDLSDVELLETIGLKTNVVIGQIRRSSSGSINVINMCQKISGRILNNPYTGTNIVASIPFRYVNLLEKEKFYEFEIKTWNLVQRKSKHNPYIFEAIPKMPVEILGNPYKEVVERKFRLRNNPLSNRDDAKILDEIGADFYMHRGRMFYELLQNADDSAALLGVKIRIQVFNNFLIIAYDGKSFDIKDFDAITSMANSRKSSDKSKTGYKGIGFKSVFTDTNIVYIKSGGFFFAFDKTSELFNSFDAFYEKVNNFVNEQQRLLFYDDFAEYREDYKYEKVNHMPWQLLPFWQEQVPTELKKSLFEINSNVVIALSMKEVDIAREYESLINGILQDSRFMLFLRRTNRIQLSRPQLPVTIAKNVKGRIVTLQNSYDISEKNISYIADLEIPIPSTNEEYQRCGVRMHKVFSTINGKNKWTMLQNIGENQIPITNIPERVIEAETTGLSFAILMDSKGRVIPLPDNTPSLYAYLPMEDRDHLLPFYVNADFMLKSQREGAKPSNPWNHFLFYNIGEKIPEWVATVASKDQPYYLQLLPSGYFTEDLEDDKKDELAVYFNRGYEKSLEEVPFILNDKEEIVCQDMIVIDDSGFADIIGPDVFCELMNIEKRLIHKNIDTTPLLSNIFTKIEHISNNIVVERILNSKYRRQIYRYWIQIQFDIRKAILFHIASMPGNKKNLDSQLCDIPAYTLRGRLYSFNKLLSSKRVILRTEAIKGIENILLKLGLDITEEEEVTHAFHKKLEKEVIVYTMHLFDIIKNQTRKTANQLSAQEKTCLFLHFASNKMGIKNEDLCAWELFSNQNGEIKSVSSLTHMDSSLYNDITKQYVIDEIEYMTVGKSLDRYMMREKDQFERIVINDWDVLVAKVGNDYDKAKSLYSLVSTTYMVAEHEQVKNKNISSLCKKNYVFVSNEMHKLDEVIINVEIAKNENIIPIIEYLTGKLVPNIGTIEAISKAPFNSKEQHLSEIDILLDNVISFEQVNQLLEYCYIQKDTIFNRYYITKVETGYRFESISKEQYIAFTDNKELSAFIELNCKNITLLPKEFSKYKNIIGILTEEKLLLKLLELIGDVKTYADKLLPIYKDCISLVKTAYIDHLSSLVLDENSFIEDSDINLQTLLMCSTIEKQEDTLFDALRTKIFIASNSVTHALTSIKLQHTIEMDGLKFPLSKLLPNEDKVAMLVDSLKERLGEKHLAQSFIDRLLGNIIDEERANDVFKTLNKSDVILENGVQLAFVIKYLESKIMSNSILCKVLDAATNPLSHYIPSYWFLNSEVFVDCNHILSSKYQDVTKYIKIPYKNEKLGCVIKKDIDDYQFVKNVLTEEEITALLNYVLKLYEEGTKLSDEDVQSIKNRVRIENKQYVVSSNYCLASEVLPVIVEQWRTSSNTEKKNEVLRILFDVHFDDSDIVKIRKYLDDGTSFSLNAKSDIISKMTCNWIYEKSIKLNNIQYSTMIDILSDKDYICEIDKEELSKFKSLEYRYTIFGDYYVYLYEGEMPWNAKLKETGYIFHSYHEKDIILEEYNIFVNLNEKQRILDLVRSLIKTDGFTAENFMHFFDQEKTRITGTLDGENDEDLDGEAREAANQLAKQEAIEWLKSKGYDTTNIVTNYSFIEGVCKADKIYNIVVKSYRSSLKELKINPNEWLYLLKPNSILMLYLGHMSFAVVDRKTLLGNHDFLRLRISSSNFNVDNNKLEENLERLAKDIQYFERTHFVFERVHDNILFRANSLEDYGLFKSNSNQEYSAGNEEDIE